MIKRLIHSKCNFSKYQDNSTIGLWLSGQINNIFKTFILSFNKCILWSYTFLSGLSLCPLYKSLIKANKESRALLISSLIFVDIDETIWLLKLL